MSGIESLRPHHALCTAFFEGKGYSDDFTAHMTEVIASLEADDPTLTVTAAPDTICSHCPNLRGEQCSGVKADRYDAAVMGMCGLREGSTLKWSELKSLVRGRIIGAGRLSEVCGDCKWQYICGGK